VTLSASDALSGVEAIEYRLDGADPLTYEGPVLVSGDGVHSLEYYATDTAGNVEMARTGTVRIDGSAPSTVHDAPSGWVSGPVLVSLSSTDPVSGVSAILYSLDGSEPSIPYLGEPVVISAQGATVIRFAAIDVRGNLEPTQQAIVFIDDNAPTTSDNAPASWVKGPVDVTLQATDTVSGVAATHYRLDGGEWTAYDSPIHLTAEGQTSIEYRSVDVKGNTEQTRTATVMIDDSAPSTASDAAGRYTARPRSSSRPPTLSGVRLPYRLDGGEWTPASAPRRFPCP
jgi:hypothetical protein